MPSRREAAQVAPKNGITFGTAHAGLVLTLMLAFLGYAANEIRSSRDALKTAESVRDAMEQRDKEKSELIERRDRAEDVMTRRIEALENRPLNCGHRG
jgi:hypothetical protein